MSHNHQSFYLFALVISLSACQVLTHPNGLEARVTQYEQAAANWAKVGNYMEAENAQRKAVAEAQKSKNPICLPDELLALSKIYMAQGRYAEADTCLNKALAGFEQGKEQFKGQDIIASLFEQQLCRTQLNMANSLRDQNRLQEAAKWYAKVLEKAKSEGLMNQRFKKAAYYDYCGYLRKAGRSQEADQLEARLRNLPDVVPDWKMLLTEARLLAAARRYREEERKLTDAYTIAETFGVDEPEFATLLTYLAMLALSKGELSRADQFLTSALSNEHLKRVDKATALVVLARLREFTGHQGDAAALYDQAMHLDAQQALAALDELSGMFADRGDQSRSASTQATRQQLGKAFAGRAK
jgi:tetratricopeptide (TPR) repeat protein